MNIAPAVLEHFPEFTESQRAVVGHLEGPLLVIAGPGSGKTHSIVLRALNLLLLKRVDPGGIVLCTFTEKAAFEMRDRVAAAARKVGYEGDLSELTISTIHGFCNQVLTRHRHRTKLGHSYETLDELTQEQLLLKLVGTDRNLCVVGDEDQSLYRFRGATVRNILEFPQHVADCTTVKLTTNYRSHRSIVERYDRWMASADWSGREGGSFRYDKTIAADPGGEYPDYPAVISIWGRNRRDEAERFADLVSFLKEHEVIADYNQVALLLHSVREDHSGSYLAALGEKGIPAFCPRSRAFFEMTEIRYLVACYAVLFGWYGSGRGQLSGAVAALADYVDDALVHLGRSFGAPHPLAQALQRWTGEIAALQEGEALDLRPADYFYQLMAFGEEKNKSISERTLFEYLSFILKLYGAQPIAGMIHLHGKKGKAMVHIGAVDAPVTISEIDSATEECIHVKQRELHVLGWEWEMGLQDLVVQEARSKGVRLVLKQIPREVMEQQAATDKGDVRFFGLAYLDAAIKRPKKLTAQVELKDFVIPNCELIPNDVRRKVGKWSDYIDYWAVDWDFRNDTFMQGWVAYRTRKDRSLRLTSDAHTYKKRGKHRILVKVVDVFGNDTSQVFDVEVK